MVKARRWPRERQRQFWVQIRRGAGVCAAAEAAGVSATSGREWFTQAGGVAPARNEPSGRYLTVAEREQIAIGVALGESNAEIGRRIGRHRSTIGRELARNATRRRARRRPRPDGLPRPRGPVPGRALRRPAREKLRYQGWHAQACADARARRPKPGRLARCPQLRRWVQDGLEQRWSPQQIARRARVEFPDRPEMWVSHETIYRSLYVQGRGELRRELTRCLRTGRALRRPHRPETSTGSGSRIRDMVMISQRPAEVTDRAVPGHWEGDLIIGKNGRSAIGTLVERATRYVLLLHLPAGGADAEHRRADQVRDAMIDAVAGLPAHLRRSLTWDQGVEMARHREINAATGLQVFFCDPHSPWQRGSNENTNGLLRQYFPKGTDLARHTSTDLARVAVELNGRPRQTLNWQTPAEALDRLLQSDPPTHGVATTT